VTSNLVGVYHVSYGYPFYAVPAVSVTANNLNSGDFYVITDSDEDGFDIVFKNAASTQVQRSFSMIAKGYGRKLA
jgi:hypothetical protein